MVQDDKAACLLKAFSSLEHIVDRQVLFREISVVVEAMLHKYDDKVAWLLETFSFFEHIFDRLCNC